MRIGHFIPAYRQAIHPSVADQREDDAVWALSNGHSWQRMWLDVFSCDLARNMAIETALRTECDYLMMQDADVWAHDPGNPTMAAPALPLLMETAEATGAGAVAAICALRRRDSRVNVEPFRPGEVYLAEKVGTGMILIDIRQIRKISEAYKGPWFARTYKDSRQTELDVGGDVFFALALRQHLVQVAVDGRIATHHADLRPLSYQPPKGSGQPAAE